MTVVRVEKSTARHIARRVVLAMEQYGEFELLQSAEGRLQFERRERPRRFLRLVERVHQVEVRIEREGRAHAVTITGELDDERRVAVEAAAEGTSVADAVLEAREGTYAVFADIFGDSVAMEDVQPRVRLLPPKRKPSAPKAPSTPQALSAAHLRLRSGKILGVPGLVTIGRNPDPVGSGGRHALGDEDMSVSKTHACFEPGIGGMTVTDLGSSNGTAVLSGGAFHDLAAHVPQLVAFGSVVRLGDLELTIGGN